MNIETFQLDIITPCFCGGAEPDKQAEIRAPSIRGQLRWWFRTLGGFKSLEGSLSLPEQEGMVFGSAAGGSGHAGKLMIRVIPGRVEFSVKDGQELGHANFSDSAYLTFPIQSREKRGSKVSYSGRGVITKGSFTLQVTWRGSSPQWQDVLALVAVFGHLGSLGFRGRRAMGALGFAKNPPDLRGALERFAASGSVHLRTLGLFDAKETIPRLGAWLKQWRAFGRTGKNLEEQRFPGYKTAKADHDLGVARLSHTATHGPSFRPSLGLPIIQFFSSSCKTVNWEWNWDSDQKRAVGRFASPVLLRPYRDARGSWHALVIFAEAHKWPAGKKVFLNGQPRDVSLDLYEAMKADPRLQPFDFA